MDDQDTPLDQGWKTSSSDDLFELHTEPAEEKFASGMPFEKADPEPVPLPGSDPAPGDKQLSDALGAPVSPLDSRVIPGAFRHVPEKQLPPDGGEKPLPDGGEKPLPDGERPVPAKKTEAVKKPEPVRKISLQHIAGATLGRILTEARKASGLTPGEVAEKTKIRLDYINALESDATGSLPPFIFIRAYTCKLRELYRLDSTACELIDESLKELNSSPDVPDKILDDINKNVQVNEEEARRIRRTGYYLVSGGFVLLTAIVALIVYFSVFSRSAERNSQNPAVPASFDPRDMERLIPSVMPEVKKFDLPAARRGTR